MHAGNREMYCGKKGAAIAWCGLSVKSQLFGDLVRYHTYK